MFTLSGAYNDFDRLHELLQWFLQALANALLKKRPYKYNTQCTEIHIHIRAHEHVHLQFTKHSLRVHLLK